MNWICQKDISHSGAMNLSLQHTHYREGIVHSLTVAVAHYFKKKSYWPDDVLSACCHSCNTSTAFSDCTRSSLHESSHSNLRAAAWNRTVPEPSLLTICQSWSHIGSPKEAFSLHRTLNNQKRLPFPLLGENIEMHTAMSGATVGDLQSPLGRFVLEDCAELTAFSEVNFLTCMIAELTCFSQHWGGWKSPSWLDLWTGYAYPTKDMPIIPGNQQSTLQGGNLKQQAVQTE